MLVCFLFKYNSFFSANSPLETAETFYVNSVSPTSAGGACEPIRLTHIRALRLSAPNAYPRLTPVRALRLSAPNAYPRLAPVRAHMPLLVALRLLALLSIVGRTHAQGESGLEHAMSLYRACSARTAWRRRQERRGPQGELPAWASLAHPQAPWIRGSDAANLGRTREAQRDIWQHQFPPGNCSGERLLVVDWPASQHGMGSQLHILSAVLSLAMRHDRVLVPTATFERANHAECNATGALSSFHCYFFPLVSPACEKAAAEAAAAGQVPACAPQEEVARDAVLASDSRVACFHGEPYNGLALEALVVKRWWGVWYERSITVEVQGKMAGEVDVMPHVHWWRAQSLRFMLRWPSPYLCHLSNRLRHTSLSLSIATRLSSSSALHSSLLRSHPHLLDKLLRNAPPCHAAAAGSVGGDGAISSRKRLGGDMGVASAVDNTSAVAQGITDRGGSSAAEATEAFSIPRSSSDASRVFPSQQHVQQGCTLEATAWARQGLGLCSASNMACSNSGDSGSSSKSSSSSSGNGSSNSELPGHLAGGVAEGQESRSKWGMEGAWEAYLPRPIVSVHVRQGDKGSEMALHSLPAHMWMAYRLRGLNPDLRHVWLSSEMQTVIDQASRFRDWTFLHSNNVRTNTTARHWDVEESAERHVVVGTSFAELIIASQCDFFIGALGSNWVRMINELRSTNGRLLNGFIAMNLKEF
ncbi:hypothetical protein CLOM_g14917 [Closterium sp. NIES-68]|nr:hypothetical protein CLOM_g14917 [Closterium sp. NIES-68]GJP80304.1 hypothetical protein CLOP_g10530 [Closterium sp. NIES-67]